jgi:hypothetical protein
MRSLSSSSPSSSTTSYRSVMLQPTPAAMPRDTRPPKRERRRRSPSPRSRSPSREDVRGRYRSRDRQRRRSPPPPPRPPAGEQNGNPTAEITHTYSARTETKPGGLGESYSSEGNKTVSWIGFHTPHSDSPKGRKHSSHIRLCLLPRHFSCWFPSPRSRNICQGSERC